MVAWWMCGRIVAGFVPCSNLGLDANDGRPGKRQPNGFLDGLTEPMSEKRMIHVFIASPGDLAVERRAFKEVIDELNGGFGDGAGVKFVPLGWEDALASTGRRSQAVINREVDRCDVLVLAMHRRWGQEASDAKPYSSYTEEEFYRAFERWRKKPRRGKERSPEIFVFFKHIDPGQMADPGPQLQKVLDFRKQLEESRQVLYHLFNDEVAFKKEVDRHLRAYARGELPRADSPREAILLPVHALEELKTAKAKAEQATQEAEREHKQAEAALARADELALELAEHAAKAALDGRVEEARQLFAKAHQGTTNLRILFLAIEFYLRTGELTTVEEMLKRCFAINGPETETVDTAKALKYLGRVHSTRGELDRAEEMHKKALAIEEKLGRPEGMAIAYGNLGVIYDTRGELDRAEEMHEKALAIEEQLGRLEGMAIAYGNLGVIYDTRGELDRAEEMHKKALAMNELLGRQEGMAAAYGNLGVIYNTRGELDRAEEMLQKALAIEEKMGRQEGMAAAYGNLGVIYDTRGELDHAEAMHKKALAINERLGRQEGMAAAYGNLGVIYNTRGELDQAEAMLKKSLAIEEKLGRQRGMASDYGNLGLIYRARGELDRAEEMFKKALAIDESLGRQEGMANQYANLGTIAEKRHALGQARELWTKASNLFAKVGVRHRVEEIQGWLNKLPNESA
jgi:tetratricopeptide (TPR) repeat protein